MGRRKIPSRCCYGLYFCPGTVPLHLQSPTVKGICTYCSSLSTPARRGVTQLPVANAGLAAGRQAKDRSHSDNSLELLKTSNLATRERARERGDRIGQIKNPQSSLFLPSFIIQVSRINILQIVASL